MIYFGEEVGEKGMDDEGFSGLNGRTTIFDWWSVDSVRRLRKLISSGEYKTLDCSRIVAAGLECKEAETFVQFAKATRLAASDLAIQKGTTYDLCYCNFCSDGFNKDKHFAFLRDYEEHTLMIVCNFSDKESKINIQIPEHAFEWMEIASSSQLNTETLFTVKVPSMGAEIIQII